MEDFEITIKCGCLKKGQCWKAKKAIANVVIFEGMEEHLKRYDSFASFLNTKGFNVYGIDTFGQGRNVNEDLSNIGVWPVDGFLKQVDHYDQLISYINKETGLPTYIFAHSMGAFMAQAYLEQYPDHVKKFVICGSGAKNPALGIGYLLAKLVTNKKNDQKKAKLLNNLMFGNFNKGIKEVKTPFDWLSYNEDNVTRYIADPLCGFGPRNRFCLEFIKGMRTLYRKENLSKISKDSSIFLISGKEDPVSSCGKATRQLFDMYKRLGIDDVSMTLYEHMRHEILNEKDNDFILEDIASFFLH